MPFHKSMSVRHQITKFGAAGLRLLPAERAHDLTIAALRSGVGLSLLPGSEVVGSAADQLRVHVPGIGELPHPVGLAAGLDKNGVAIDAWQRMGFAAVEVGTVTPLPQAGNPKPRLFRYPERRGIINRMGFNNHGIGALLEQLGSAKATSLRIPLGINLGKNKVTPPENALTDYETGFRAVTERKGPRGEGEYYVINISSPNTPGLRDLARPEFLLRLSDMAGALRNKTWIKLDPDMERGLFQANIEAIAKAGFGGVILSNTHRVEWPEAGGLSGHGLLSHANRSLEWAWQVHRGQLPMIGCGGILDGADILGKILRGASAVQIYTALIYRGPWVVVELLQELNAEMAVLGFKSLAEARGSHYLA